MLFKSENAEEVVKRLFKDVGADYNPSTIAKKIGMTREGAFIILKDLEKRGIVRSKVMGKANFYYLNLEDEYVRKLIEVLLIDEARIKKERWIHEFEDIFNNVDVAVMFGSMLTDEKKAGDIDLLLVFDERDHDKVKKAITFKNQVIEKHIHPIMQTRVDLVKNMRQRDKVIMNALSFGIVLYGHEEFVGLVKDGRKE